MANNVEFMSDDEVNAAVTAYLRDKSRIPSNVEGYVDFSVGRRPQWHDTSGSGDGCDGGYYVILREAKPEITKVTAAGQGTD